MATVAPGRTARDLGGPKMMRDVVTGLAITPVILAALGLLAWWPMRSSVGPESRFVVEVTNGGVSVTGPDGARHTAAWSDIHSFRIHTNDSGPWGSDVIWGFHDAPGKPLLAVPMGATGESEMIQALSKLPGWRDDVVIAAAGSTSNRVFVCWEADPAHESLSDEPRSPVGSGIGRCL